MPDPSLYASVVSALVPLRKETGGNLRAADWNQLLAAVAALAQGLGGSEAGGAEMPAPLPGLEGENPPSGGATLPEALLSLESRLSSLESSIAALPSRFAPDSSAEVALLRGRLETLTDIYPRLERAEAAARTPTQTALAMQDQQLRLQEGHAQLARRADDIVHDVRLLRLRVEGGHVADPLAAQDPRVDSLLARVEELGVFTRGLANTARMEALERALAASTRSLTELASRVETVATNVSTAATATPAMDPLVNERLRSLEGNVGALLNAGVTGAAQAQVQGALDELSGRLGAQLAAVADEVHRATDRLGNLDTLVAADAQGLTTLGRRVDQLSSRMEELLARLEGEAERTAGLLLWRGSVESRLEVAASGGSPGDIELAGRLGSLEVLVDQHRRGWEREIGVQTSRLEQLIGEVTITEQQLTELRAGADGRLGSLEGSTLNLGVDLGNLVQRIQGAEGRMEELSRAPLARIDELASGLESIRGHGSLLDGRLATVETGLSTANGRLEEGLGGLDRRLGLLAELSDSTVGRLGAAEAGLSHLGLSMSSELSRIGVLEGSLSSLADGRLALAEGQLRDLDGRLGTQSLRLGSVEVAIAPIQETVGSLQGSLATLSSRADTLESGIGTLGGSLSLLEHNIGAVGETVGTFSALSETVGSLQGSVATLSTRADTLESSVATVSSRADTLESSLSTVSLTVSTVSSSLSTLEYNANIVGERVGSLSSLAETVAGLSRLNDTVATIQSSVSDLSSTVRSQAGQIKSVSTTVATQAAQLGSLDSSMKSISSSVGSLSGTVSTLDSSLRAVSGTVASLDSTLSSQLAATRTTTTTSTLSATKLVR